MTAPEQPRHDDRCPACGGRRYLFHYDDSPASSTWQHWTLIACPACQGTGKRAEVEKLGPQRSPSSVAKVQAEVRQARNRIDAE